MAYETYGDALRANIPPTMLQTRQWMVCNNQKQPIDPVTGYLVAKSNPENWLAFGDAEYFSDEYGYMIGFVPRDTDPFTIIDLDFKTDRDYSPEAASLKEQIRDALAPMTYVEKSVSGKGYHAIIHGKLSADFNQQKLGIEAYGHKGFVVMTGFKLDNSPSMIGENAQLMAWLESSYASKVERAEVSLDMSREATPEELAQDQAFLDWCKDWKNSAEIESWFYAKEVGPDGKGGSDGDARLIQLFYKFNNGRQGDRVAHTLRMFMRSPRAKLLGRKQDPRQYLERTIAKAKAWIDNEEQQKEAATLNVSRMAEAYFAAEQARKAAAPEQIVVQAPTLPDMHAGQSTNGHNHMNGNGSHSQVNSMYAPGTEPRKLFEILNPDQVKGRASPKWMIRGVLPQKGIAALYGPSGSGKSFVALDLIARVAEGDPWFNRRSYARNCVYLSLEGGGLKNRILAWEHQNGGQVFPSQVGIIEDQIDLRDPEFLNQLCLSLNPVGDKFNGLIVIDTLNQSCAGMDENSSRDMGEVIKALRYLEKMTNSLILFVHHATKSAENRSMRGHGSLFAACDAVIELEKSDVDQVRTWNLIKSKDSADGQQGMFKLQEWTVGYEPFEPVEGVPVPPNAKGPEITSVAIAAFDQVVIDDDGEPQVQNPAPPQPPREEKPSRGRRSGSNSSGPNGASKVPMPPLPGDAPTGVRGKTQHAIWNAVSDLIGPSSHMIDGKPWAEYHAVVDRAASIVPGADPIQKKKDIGKAIKGMYERGVIHLSPDLRYARPGGN